MTVNSPKRVALFVLSFLLCFIFIVPLSLAEQPPSEFTKQIFSAEDLMILKVVPQEKGVERVIPAVVDPRQAEPASFDVKVPVNERLNAIVSVGRPFITDISGRDIKQNYNAVVGFQIILQ